MRSLVACTLALGVLLMAPAALAAPNTPKDADLQQIEAEKRQFEAEKQRGFKTFRDFLSVAFTRTAPVPRENFEIVLTGIFIRDDFPKDKPFELVYKGTVSTEGGTPKDMYEIHLSGLHLVKSPDEYLQYTAAQITCRMVKRLNQGGLEEGIIAHKCACEAVGEVQCVVVHHHIAQLQGHVPKFRSPDELAIYLQTMADEVKKRYGITRFERP